MKTIKVLSIIGIVVSVLSVLCIAGLEYSDPLASTGWGYIGNLYALALSITALCISLKKQ